MKKLILTVGLPRSGKSTWAKSSGYPVVNPDSIRLALHGQAYIGDAEVMVWPIAMMMVRSLFLAGHCTVVVDATNVTVERRSFWLSPKWDVEYMRFDASKEMCIERAINSQREDLIPVIERMSKAFEEVKQ